MIGIIVGIVILAILVVSLRVWIALKRPSGQHEESAKVKRSGTLQDFLPLERYHESGAMLVDKQFKRQIRVGDVNLYSLSLVEITAMRNRFRDALKRLDNPFQISVQARRANYHDYVEYAVESIDAACAEYQNPSFLSFSEQLKRYLRAEAMTPRTDRENLIVVGVTPKMSGEKEAAQLERLDREQNYVEAGLSSMGLSHEVLDAVESVEALQNFWNRERAVHQRYRNLLRRQVHVPIVKGTEEVTEHAIQQSTQI